MLQNIKRLFACMIAGWGLTAGASQPAMMVVPEPVQVPVGHRLSLKTTGVGEITYECRAKAGSTGTYEWVFVAPVATLYDVNRQIVGKYYAGPTWETMDGSQVTGKQVAVAPAQTGSIPLQLVKAEPATGNSYKNVAYIQRLNTKGGVAPSASCDATHLGKRQSVPYEADYLFYTSSM